MAEDKKPQTTGSGTEEKDRNTVPGYENPQEDEAYQANKAIKKERDRQGPSPEETLVEKRGGAPD